MESASVRLGELSNIDYLIKWPGQKVLGDSGQTGSTSPSRTLLQEPNNTLKGLTWPLFPPDLIQHLQDVQDKQA